MMLTFLPTIFLCFICTANASEGYSKVSKPRGRKIRFTDYQYEESSEHIDNPGRGFAHQSTGVTSNWSPLTTATLKRWRDDEGVTIARRNFVLDLYKESFLDDELFDLLEADLDAVREARFTAVIRFSYTNVRRTEPPYGDTTKAWMLIHIAQLSTFLHDYEDVIDQIQAGFIGIWGEWYYTSAEFGDPNIRDWRYPRGYTPTQWQNRREILQAVIDASPDTISVQIRYPGAKQEIVNDYSPTTRAEAVFSTYKSRTGSHNDCFLADFRDKGTYQNITEFLYLLEDSRYTSNGGETCEISTNPPGRSDCPTAMDELAGLHFSWLNIAYNRDVLALWAEQGCFNGIHRRLGYRLVLRTASLPDTVQQDGLFSFRLEMTNTGFAAPQKDVDVSLILRNGNNVYEATLEDLSTIDWQPESSIVISDEMFVTRSVPTGEYQVFLAIKDVRHPEWSDFHILLANTNVPQHRAGLNDLGHTVTVSAGGNDEQGNAPAFTASQLPEISQHSRLFCGLPGICDNTKCRELIVDNPSFEITGQGWVNYEDGFEYTTDRASHGIQSVRIDGSGGARQVFYFTEGVRSFTVKADSISEDVIGETSSYYSIYCDVKLADGQWMYGRNARFNLNQLNWQTETLNVTATQDIAEGWCYGMFRTYLLGTAWFDNFSATVNC